MLGTRNMSSLISVNLNVIKQPDLISTFNTEEENSKRMSEFFVTGLTKDIIDDFQENLAAGKSRSYLIAGRPGVGKTTLLLFLANLLNTSGNEPLFDIMKDRAGDSLADTKKQLGKFLVVFPQPITQPDEVRFNSNLITAINGAIAQKGYQFAPSTGDSLTDTLKETIDFLKSNTDIKGIAIMMGDMAPLISEMEKDEPSPATQQIFDFLDFLKIESDMPVAFVGTGSFLPNNYATFGVERDSMNKVGSHFDRLLWFEYNDDEWIGIIRGNILQQTSPDALVVLTTNPEFMSLATFINNVGLYSEKGEKYVLNNILPGTFPLHPFTLYFLPRLSQKISSEGKNLMAFFRDSSPGSFRYFLETFSIFQASGKLSVYTPDYLFSYYENTIKQSTSLRNIYNSVEKAYMLSGNLPLARRVIRLVALMQIIDDPTIRPTKKNIMESLHLIPRDSGKFEPMLIEMIQKGGFSFDPETQEVMLPVERTGINLREYINAQVEKIKDSFDPAELLNSRYTLKNEESIEYNTRFSTDRKAYRRYVNIKDLRDDDFASGLMKTLGRGCGKNLGSVGVLYMVTDDDDELMEARNILTQEDRWASPIFVVAVPIRPPGFLSLLMEKVALEDLAANVPPFTKPNTPERDLLESQLKEIDGQISDKMEYYLRPDRLYWYYQKNLIRQMQNKSINELADALMEENFTHFPIIPNPVISSFQDKKTYRVYRANAVEKILTSIDTIKIPMEITDPVNTIIRDVLVNFGILEKLCEKDDFIHYKVIHGMIDMASTVKDIWNYLYQSIITAEGEGKKVIQIDQIITPLLSPPYGLTPSLLEVLLASIFRICDHEVDIFKNYREMQKTGEQGALIRLHKGYEAIRAISTDPEDCIVYLTEFPAEEKLFVNKVIEMFTRQTKEYADTPLWAEGKKAVMDWFESLSEMTRKNINYEGKYTVEFLDRITKEGKEKAPREFFRELLPEALGYRHSDFSFKEHALILLERMKNVYIETTRFSQLKKVALWKAVRTMFAGKEKDFGEMFKQWEEDIPEDLNFDDLPTDSKILLEVDPTADLETQFLNRIPEEMGLKSIEAWEYDKTMEYLARLSRAKMEIDMGDILTIFRIPEKKEPKNEVARNIMEKVFAKIGVDESEKEIFIVELMEKMVWE